jgi:hypothetical protein
MRVLISLIAALVLGSCSPQYSDFFPYHDDGTPKPYVALIPVFDETHEKLPMDVTGAFSKQIRYLLMKQGKLFLPTQNEMSRKLKDSSKQELTATNDLMPYLHFQPAHFVVLLELVEHKEVPYQRGKIKPIYTASIDPDRANVLQMKMRLRVVDIRGGEPRLIRQEVLESNHVIPKNAVAEGVDMKDSEAFSSTPLGLAYARFERDIAQKIEKITSYQKP